MVSAQRLQFRSRARRRAGALITSYRGCEPLDACDTSRWPQRGGAPADAQPGRKIAALPGFSASACPMCCCPD